MKNLPLLALTTVGLLVTTQARAQERSIKRSELPAAVAKTVASVSQGATVRGYSREVENGQTLYEVEMRVHGHGKDVTIDTTGAVVEEEEEIAFAKLPASVQAGIRAAAGACPRLHNRLPTAPEPFPVSVAAGTSTFATSAST